MTDRPHLVSLEPLVLDASRVTLNLKTTGFPPVPNVAFTLNAPAPADAPAPAEESPYPNVELSLLDADDRLVAQAIIVEHREEEVSFTLHIRRPRPGATYTARAEMIHGQNVLQTLRTPFVLEPPTTTE
ncbi:MAG: hypothetical protein D6796_16925 [Caldilineae bacterium]|nr:MAG: hypothetical protein D6796_16925 [Caldilineae bacterium]